MQPPPSFLKMVCYSILRRLSLLPGSDALVAKSAELLSQLYKQLIYKLKSDAVKQEQDRLEEVQANAMRTVVALSKIPGFDETETHKKLMISFNKRQELMRAYQAGLAA